MTSGGLVFPLIVVWLARFSRLKPLAGTGGGMGGTGIGVVEILRDRKGAEVSRSGGRGEWRGRFGTGTGVSTRGGKVWLLVVGVVSLEGEGWVVVARERGRGLGSGTAWC